MPRIRNSSPCDLVPAFVWLSLATWRRAVTLFSIFSQFTMTAGVTYKLLDAPFSHVINDKSVDAKGAKMLGVFDPPLTR